MQFTIGNVTFTTAKTSCSYTTEKNFGGWAKPHRTLCLAIAILPHSGVSRNLKVA